MSYAKPIPRNGTLADVAEGNRLNAFRALGTVLIKLHTVRDWYDFLGGGDQEPVMEGVVDALFITHRDIRDAVRSIRDMGWGVPFTDSQRAHKDFCRRRITSGNRVRYLTPDEYKKPETWVSLARSQIRCREVLLETAGAAVKMDVRAEDLSNMDFTETIALLKELGRNLDYEYSDAELDLAAKELRKIRPSRCDSGYEIEMTVNPVTHLHKGHVRPMKSLDAHVGMDAITQDEICAAWLKRYLYDV